jgi:precorrin-6B methylase 2
LPRRSAVLGLAIAASLAAQADRQFTDVPFVPTPPNVVDAMLDLANIKPADMLIDLGSGDGRIVIAAAKKYKAYAVGVEFDDALAKQSADKIKSLGLASLASIIHGDLLKQDYASADLLTVYLLPMSNNKVTPILEKQLKKGTRIVAHDFEFSAWKPVKVEDIDDDGEGRSHHLYLYIR